MQFKCNFSICNKFIKRFYGACGIIGMPNIGKSTLFNALTKTQLAESANYPFCTIKPNHANIFFLFLLIMNF